MEYSQEKRAGLNHVRFADEELIKTQVLQGEAAQTIIQGENCSVYKMENETGEGVITRYPVFPGIELLYDDIHMSCGVAHREDPRADLLEINHCRLGRFECEFSDGSAVYLGEGDLAVNVMTNQTRETWFPLSHYHGITILLDLDAISPEMRKQMEWYGVDLDVIRRYICTENRCCILRSEPTIAHIFSELYTAHSVPDTGYLRLKVLELLHILTRLKNREDVQQTEYFNQHQVECVKQAAALLTQELTVRRTIEQLAQEVGLSPTALKSCFKGIYGSSVYAYQKEYRLQLAQKLLLETDCTVAEIAHRVGYENPNKFSSAFREAAGMTPTEYRKMRPIG